MAIKHNPQNDGTAGNIGQADYNADHTIDAGTIGTTELAATAVTPGAYTNANLTIGADGRVTAAANGSGGGITNSAGANVIPKSDGTNLVASQITDDGTTVAVTGALSIKGLSATLISPAGITGTVNDWAPTGFSGATTVLVTSSLGAVTLNGLAGGANGRRVRLVNYDATQVMNIANEAGASVAGNRIVTGYNNPILLVSGGYQSVDLEYWGSRWHVVAMTCTAPPGVSFTTQVGLAGGANLNGQTISSFQQLTFSSTALLRSGTGTPEGVLTAPVGSLFLRTDGGASTTLYVKESGAGNTGWVGK